MCNSFFQKASTFAQTSTIPDWRPGNWRKLQSSQLVPELVPLALLTHAYFCNHSKSMRRIDPAQSTPRWDGIRRPYTSEDVNRLRGTLHIEHTLARRGA